MQLGIHLFSEFPESSHKTGFAFTGTDFSLLYFCVNVWMFNVSKTLFFNNAGDLDCILVLEQSVTRHKINYDFLYPIM